MWGRISDYRDPPSRGLLHHVRSIPSWWDLPFSVNGFSSTRYNNNNTTSTTHSSFYGPPRKGLLHFPKSNNQRNNNNTTDRWQLVPSPCHTWVGMDGLPADTRVEINATHCDRSRTGESAFKMRFILHMFIIIIYPYLYVNNKTVLLISATNLMGVSHVLYVPG